jgi:hypothetical protein
MGSPSPALSITAEPPTERAATFILVCAIGPVSARELAELWLATSQPRRWQHVRGVGVTTASITPERSPPTWRSTPAWSCCTAPGYSPHDNPVAWIWAALKNHVANTAVSWPGRLRQIRSFFRARSPDQMLTTAAPGPAPGCLPVTSRTSRMVLSGLSTALAIAISHRNGWSSSSAFSLHRFWSI